ncbi:Methyltransferase domain [Seminavis robusta]|uniref:Methyltransferase domain n=1 Tax=Seminavis robusta TaxID=568900 RepID=A0A9N8E993_9STRA|nr:Methyltransferase domain [Seminavis robusta]|eukprot:Sro813_g206220.1 Methyltransferase domain (464) ;mRNA; r:32086-33477
MIPKWLFLVLSVVIALSTRVAGAQDKRSPEDLFHETAEKWQGRYYQHWDEFAATILERFKKEEPVVTDSSANGGSKTLPPRLDLIGALEESILIIERNTLHEGANKKRDNALSKLYHAYGYTLLQLTAIECQLLALDPHTLLIGAETIKNAASPPTPSTHICTENAENTLRNAVTLDATNAEAQALLDTILEEEDGVHTRKPLEFMAALFDGFADTFDEKLLKGLNYQVPKLVGDVVNKFAKKNGRKTYRHALDAGSGTGLAGRYLRPLVSGLLIGVDASQKMLDIAADCTLTAGCGLPPDPENNKDDNKGPPLYDGLLAMDLEAMTVASTLLPFALKANPQETAKSTGSGFDLVVAADVLVYFGSLDTVIRTFRQVSVPGALLVFSCERTTSEEAPLGYRLLPSGRFAHTREHVEKAASKVGYVLRSYEEIVPRQEKGEDVLGHLFAFELERQQDGSGRDEL